ncbi:MAG: YbjN domain-containing protein [Desulfobacterota bacterium]|nr:YbjN domain-containing protein [Thermodesulfobacteriota bacterium]
MEQTKELMALHEKVMRFFREMDVTFEVTKEYYRVRSGSTAVIVHPLQLRENKTLLRIVAVVLSDVKKQGNEAMFEEFNETNSKTIFGKIYWEPYQEDADTGNVFFETYLIGETMDFEEFSSVLVATAKTADEIDDKLKSTYGGKRFYDD